MFRRITALLMAAILIFSVGCNRAKNESTSNNNLSGTVSESSKSAGSSHKESEKSSKTQATKGSTKKTNAPSSSAETNTTSDNNSDNWQIKRPSGDRTKAVIPADFYKNNTTGVLKNLHGLNFIDDTTPWTVVKPVNNADKKARVKGEPFVVDIKYDDGMGLCVALYNVVQDFGAKADGKTDDTAAIQSALQAAQNKGGGVVYLPEGKYLCGGSILIPSGVTLRGEWINPNAVNPGSRGTVLLVTGNKGNESAAAFIRLSPGAGLRNVTILYPEQSAGKFSAYPPAIQQITDSPANDSYTVMNTTIAGAWIGYQGSTGWSELHYLKNVYITAFKNAIMLDNVTDIGRLEGVHLGPEYFIKNTVTLINTQDAQTIRNFMFENSVGLWMKRSDWEYTYDFSAVGLNRGILLLKNSAGRAPNAQFMKMNFTNCKVAIEITGTNGIGCAFTDVSISGNESCEAGLLLSEGFNETSQFENLHIKGKIREQLSYKGSGRITVVNSIFEGWDTASRYAINMHKGGISLQQCTLKGSLKHITVSDKCGGVSVLGCTFSGSADIAYNKSRSAYVTINHDKLNLPVKSGRQHIYRQSIPKPTSMYLYNVVDYGAKVNTDSTTAFTKALAAARKTGGTVFVPAGEYTISSPLTVPSGVELRGIYDVPTHSRTAGSVLSTTYGKGSESGQALIQLESGSGINGISFYYPEQSYTNFIAYPWTVQSKGPNCWAINAVFINSYNALDFGTNPSDGHYIQYVGGAPIRRGIFIGSNKSNGWVENVQFNPHYWKRSAVSVKPKTGEAEFNHRLNTSLDAFIMGHNASEHMLGNFAFGAKNLMLLISQGGKGTNGTIIGHGADGCRNALVVEQADVVEFINSEMVSMNYSGDMYHIDMKNTVTGTVALFNSMMWAQPSTSLLVKGGTLIVNQLQYYMMESTKYLLDTSGGKVHLSTVLMPPKVVQVRISGNADVQLVGNLMKQMLSFVPPSGGASVRTEKIGGTIKEYNTWWA